MTHVAIIDVNNYFFLKEIQNILRKVKRTKIRTDFKILLENYFGKEVNTYKWCNDLWIVKDK